MKAVEPIAPCRGAVSCIDGDCLSIDPGIHTGWARWHQGRLTACGSGSPPARGIYHVVIELPQIYPNSPVPPQSLIALAFTAGRIVGALDVADTKFVLPHVWKGNLHKDVHHPRVMKKLTQPELDVVAEARAAIRGKFDDVMDAVALGLWAFGGRG
jgi:hypothetical protein